MVKRSLSQSHEEPIFLSWDTIRLPYCSFHAQARRRNSSLPISSFVMPSLRIASTIFASVAIEAWSVPGSQSAANPDIRL